MKENSSEKAPLGYVIVLLLLLFIGSAASLCAAVVGGSAAAFGAFSVNCILFTAVYCAGVLGYEVGGQYVSLKREVERLKHESTDLQQISTSLYKAILATSYFSGAQASGMLNKQADLIKLYLKEVRRLVPEGTDDVVDKDVRESRVP